MTTKKVLIIGSSQGIYGGIEAFMIAVAKAASKWEELEIRLCFKAVKGATFEDKLKKMARVTQEEPYFVERGSSQLLQLIKWADVVHVQNMPPDIVFPARLMGKKVLGTVHNRKFPETSLHNLIWSRSIKLLNKRWYNSNFVWSTWEPNTKSKNSRRVPTVSNLPSLEIDPEHRKGFVFVGRWIKNKGIEELLKAYAESNLNPKEWPLTIMGDGPLREKILKLAKDLRLDDVQMPGFISEKEKQQELSSAKWLVAPAKTQEDMGLTPIEARNVGVPSIVTRDGGLPEAGGEAALIAEPDNVADLTRCLLKASEMQDEEYLKRASLSKSSLKDFLEPMEFYRDQYNTI